MRHFPTITLVAATGDAPGGTPEPQCLVQRYGKMDVVRVCHDVVVPQTLHHAIGPFSWRSTNHRIEERIRDDSLGDELKTVVSEQGRWEKGRGSMLSVDVEQLKAKRICSACVGEAYLSREIEEKGMRRKCRYCREMGRTYPIGEMAGRIEIAFGQHYVRTSDQPDSYQSMLLRDKESDYDWDREGQSVVYAIMDAAQIPEVAAHDIQAVLADEHGDFDSAAMGEETEFSVESYYERKGASGRTWLEEWDSFERALKTEARFFSSSAAAHLASVFDGINEMSTYDKRPLVINAGPDTNFRFIYRARVFQSDDKLEAALCRPDIHLGSPPAPLAAAGRMNARGISVFYGANDEKVAIAEVRAPVGSQVAVAKFEIIRKLWLLDLTLCEMPL